MPLSISLTQNIDPEIPDGVFSFTLYYNGGLDELMNSVYYYGIQSYLEAVHNAENLFFTNWYVIIYTNEKSINLLKAVFPHETYPKLIIAECHWPEYEIDGDFDNYILRCMRFHAISLFRKSDVAVRDADTLFPSNFNDIIEDGDDDEERTRRLKVLYKKIANWELEFLQNIVKEPEFNNKYIAIGTAPDYIAGWHANMPLKKAFNPDINFLHLHDCIENPMFFRTKHGIYAGFVTFFKNEEHNYWTDIENYLTNRYYKIEYDNQLYISNKFIPPCEKNLAKKGKEVYMVNYGMGKDERAILFGIIPYHLEDCYFYYIKYSSGQYPSINYARPLPTLHSNVITNKIKNKRPAYIKLLDIKVENIASYKNNNETSYHQLMYNYFSEFRDKYLEWLSNLKSNVNHSMNIMANKMQFKSNIYKNDKNKKKVTKNNLFIGGKRTRKSKKRAARKTRKMKHRI
jgi:hypothetical protein